MTPEQALGLALGVLVPLGLVLVIAAIVLVLDVAAALKDRAEAAARREATAEAFERIRRMLDSIEKKHSG